MLNMPTWFLRPPHFNDLHILTDSLEQAQLDQIHCCHYTDEPAVCYLKSGGVKTALFDWLYCTSLESLKITKFVQNPRKVKQKWCWADFLSMIFAGSGVGQVKKFLSRNLLASRKDYWFFPKNNALDLGTFFSSSQRYLYLPY